MSSKRTRTAVTALALLLVARTLAAQDEYRDPMQPYRPAAGGTAVEPTAPSWRLSGVLIAAARRVAVINGQTVQVGDRVDGAEVLEISPQAARLRTAAGERVIPLRTRQSPVQSIEGDSQ